MNQKQWVEYFKEINGREPKPDEFANARKAGEFSIEKIYAIESDNDNILLTEAKQKVKTIISSYSGDIRRLKKDIQESEVVQLELFYELGLQVYLDTINKEIKDYDEQIKKIVVANTKTYGLKQKYNTSTLRDRECLSCGTPLKENDRFCPICGSDSQKLEAEIETNKKVCSLCYSEQDSRKPNCDCCGLNF